MKSTRTIFYDFHAGQEEARWDEVIPLLVVAGLYEPLSNFSKFNEQISSPFNFRIEFVPLRPRIVVDNIMYQLHPYKRIDVTGAGDDYVTRYIPVFRMNKEEQDGINQD